MKTKIYKVPFYVTKDIIGNKENYFCENKGMVVVRKNIIGKTKEIITGFNGFFYANNESDESFIDDMIYSCMNGFSLYDTDSSFLEKNIQRDGFAISIDKNTFTDKNLATLEDIEDWEKNFANSEFYKCYEQMHIIPKEEKKAMRGKVKSLKA